MGEKGRKRVPLGVRKGKKGKGGRDNSGKVTVRHQGGGEKRVRRKRVNGGREKGVGRVRGIQNDGNRTGLLGRVKVMEGEKVKEGRKGTYKYVLAVEGRKVGDRIKYGESELESRVETGKSEGMGYQRRGSTRRRGNRTRGSKVSNVSVKKGGSGKRRRAGGIRGEVVQKREGKVQIRRKGGEVVEVSERCTGTVGGVRSKTREVGEKGVGRMGSGPLREGGEVNTLGRREKGSSGVGKGEGKEKRGGRVGKGKAGVNRRRGKRPTVRGEAMNPIDHPHGGRTRGGRQEVTPWSRLAKGVRTGKKRKKGWTLE